MAVCCVFTGQMFKFVSSAFRSPPALTSSKCFYVRTFATSTWKRASEAGEQGDGTQKQKTTYENPPDSSQSQREDEYEYLVRQRILQASLPHVHAHGWTKQALEAGARDEGLPSVAHGMFPRGGAELVHFFYAKSNLKLADTLKLETEKSESQGLERPKTKPFIRNALEIRLRMIIPYLDTWPQALVILALPQNITESRTNLLKLADDIWYYAGDRSVDFNWYTKRLALAAVYKSTEIYMIQDKSTDLLDTWVFLDNRLADLQRIGACRKSCQQSGNILKEAVVGFSIMGRNILGLNSRNR